MILAWQKNKKVERTSPGSKNPYKVTYHDGQQKWTDDLPGDGKGGRREHRKEERKQNRPSIKDDRVKLDGALKSFVDGNSDEGSLSKAVDDVIVHLGREVARETLGKWISSKGDVDGKAKEGLEVIRKRKIDVLRKKEAMSNRIDRIAKKLEARSFIDLEKGHTYRVLKHGASLNKMVSTGSFGYSGESKDLPVGAEIKFIGEFMGLGGDNIKLPHFNYNGFQGHFSPEYWGSIEEGWLEDVSMVLASKEMTLVKNDDLMLRDVYEWVHKQKSWFEWDYDGENLTAVTREHGSVGEERAGKEDIKEAKRLKGLIDKQFGDAVKVTVEPVDEWVDITVEIIKKMKKSSDVRIDRIASNLEASGVTEAITREIKSIWNSLSIAVQRTFGPSFALADIHDRNSLEVMMKFKEPDSGQDEVAVGANVKYDYVEDWYVVTPFAEAGQKFRWFKPVVGLSLADLANAVKMTKIFGEIQAPTQVYASTVAYRKAYRMGSKAV